MSQPTLRLAVIGCGAVSKLMHLPALAQTPGLHVAALVDADAARARALAEVYRVPTCHTDYRALGNDIQAVLVALPNHLHASASTHFLQRGVHVYVEKPMALTVADCEAMLRAAQVGSATLAVGLMRRAYPAMRLVKEALAAHALGPLQSITWREGYTAGWETTSDFIARPEQAGGGVLTDLGAHILDILAWWLGPLTVQAYFDDAQGGLEANCQAHLQAGVVPIEVEISRGRTLANTVRIQGTQAFLDVGVGPGEAVTWGCANPAAPVLVGSPNNTGRIPQRAILREMFQDFAHAIAHQRPPLAPGQAGRDNVALIQHCYAMRQPLVYPWEANS